MSRVSRSRFLVAVLFLGLVFPITFLTTQLTTAQPATRPSRDGLPRAVVELPPFAPEAAAVARPPESRATTSPELPWTRVVFYDRNADKWDIYISSDDGSDRRQLTNTRAVEVEPDLSRGGGTVVYSSDEDGDFEIMAMNAQGGGAHALTNNSKNDGQPRFSPDNSRIVFVSERDGQAEIYTMRADGSGQTRLTASPGYDGDPTWSPDGTKIAFSSNRTGGYRIWVMNADGSDQRQLSDAPFSLYPAWSPDGEAIAFSAEGDTDGFLDIMLMNADGSDEHKALNASGQADAVVRSWSPDGKRIAFTRWDYVQYQGQWYIGSTVLMSWELGDYNADTLAAGVQYPFDPAWQTLDAKPPRSSLSPLPARAPADVVVSWSATDEGGSGVRAFDVQVRVNDGAWTDWDTGKDPSTSATFQGTSGQRLAFRVRARDYATNLEPWSSAPQVETTIEQLPPRTTITPLPPYTRFDRPFTVQWSGADPGGSGISGFVLQYRIEQGAWTDWQVDTPATSAEFEPAAVGLSPGARVAFRVRGTDRAGNVEAWTPDPGDTSTVFYTWAVTGRVTDNTGVPVGDAMIDTTPETIGPVMSNVDGTYGAFGKATAAAAALSWAKPGYGALPLTTFGTAFDARADVVLPPANNVIMDGGFEGGWPGPWTAGGSLAARLSAEDRISGESAAFLGERATTFGPPQILTPAPEVYNGEATFFLLAGKRPLVARYANGTELIFSEQAADGNWKQDATKIAAQSFSYQLTDDAAGQLHVVYQTVYEGPYLYQRRGANGAWSTPEQIPMTDTSPGALVAGADGLHLFGWNQTSNEIIHLWRNSSGWQGPEVVSAFYSVYSPDLRAVIGPDGILHLVWAMRLGAEVAVSGRDRLPGGAWREEARISTEPPDQSITYLATPVVNAIGQVYVAWTRFDHSGGGPQPMVARQTGGVWEAPVAIPAPPGGEAGPLVLSRGGQPRLGYATTDAIYLLERSAAGAWHSQAIASFATRSGEQATARGGGVALDVDAADRTHAAWLVTDAATGKSVVRYRWRGPDGGLSPILAVPGNTTDHALYQDVRVEASGTPHVVWQMRSDIYNYQEPAQVAYSGLVRATVAGEATLSQTVAVPATMARPVLSFSYESPGAGGNVSDLDVLVGGQATPVPATSTGLGHFWLDMAAYAGQTVPVTFRLRQTAGAPLAWAALDDVSLGTAHPDAWVAAAGGVALPGETVDLYIHLGNRAGVPAGGVALTLALPPELVFVSAAPAPTGQSPLSWALGSLPPGDEATVVVTVRVAAGAKPFTTVNATAAVNTDDELETLNNSAVVGVRLQRNVYMPGVVAP